MQANYLLLCKKSCDYVRQLVSFVLLIRQRAISQELFDLFFAVPRPEQRSLHSVRVRRQFVDITRRAPRSGFFRAHARLAEVAMPDREGNTKRASSIPRCRLNPNRIKWPFAEDATIAYTVERHPARHAQPVQASPFVRVHSHLQHHFFSDDLDTSRQIHGLLRYPRFRSPWGSSEQPRECSIRHPQAVRISKILLIHSQAAVFSYFDELLLDQRNVLRRSIRRQAHDFVLAAVDPEASVVRKGAVEQAEAVGESQFFEQRDLVALAGANRAGRPLAHSV